MSARAPARIKVGDRWIGAGEPCYIIAEAGSNHNGNLEQALGLIDVASDAGADAVKFQGFRAQTLYPRTAGKSEYLKDERPIYDIIEAMEMPFEWVPILADHCYKCHSTKATKLKGGPALDSRERALKGGNTGPAIAAND